MFPPHGAKSARVVRPAKIKRSHSPKELPTRKPRNVRDATDTTQQDVLHGYPITAVGFVEHYLEFSLSIHLHFVFCRKNQIPAANPVEVNGANLCAIFERAPDRQREYRPALRCHTTHLMVSFLRFLAQSRR
jgi:hypothetical protein